MKSNLPTILYVPGLGDRYDLMRRFCLSFWRLWGVRAILVPVQWYDGENAAAKRRLLEEAIQRYNPTIIIGESAGATLVLNAASHKTSGVKRFVTLCGVTSPQTPIGMSIRQKAPALEETTSMLKDEYVTPETIRCYRAYYDPVVGKKYSLVPGVEHRIIPFIGHLSTIAACLTIFAPWFISSIQKK